MSRFVALVIFLAVCAGLAQLAGFDLGFSGPQVPANMTLSAGDAANARATLTADAIRQEQWRAAQAATQQAQQVQADQWARQETAVAHEATMAVHGTATAQAWQATVTASSAQATSTAVVEQAFLRETLVALDIQKTLDASTASGVATAQAAQASVADNKAKQEDIKTQRMEMSKSLQAFAPFALFLVVVGFAIAALWIHQNWRVVPRGADGSAAVIVAGGRVINADRAPGVVTDIRNPAPVDPQIQAAVTRSEQLVQAARALSLGSRPRQAQNVVEQMAAQPDPQISVEEPLPNEAPWASLSTWSGGPFPLGIGAGKQGIRLDPNITPHLMVAGTSGSGKTMNGLRPLAALGLVSGWQVILANDAGGDFAPFGNHPNLSHVRGDAVQIADALEAMVAEVERRSHLLAAAGVSTYDRMPTAQAEIGPRVMFVIDELVALAQQATGDLSGRIWRAAIHITSKGRKMGVMFVCATTDPTYRTLARPGLIVRDNCARLVFRVRDESVSRAALDSGGAEQLGVNQFIAQLDGAPVRGVAFHPGDEDIRMLLGSRSVPALPAPKWLLESGRALPVYEEETIGLARKIEAGWKSGMSKRKLAEIAGGVYAGAFAGKIDKAIAYLNATTTPSVPESGMDTE